MRWIKWINGLILAAIWLGSAGWGQAAPTFTVNSTADVAVVSGALDNGICETAIGNGICTLRAAIIKANHWPGGGVTINVPALAPGEKYLLTIPPSKFDDETTGNLNIDRDMNIVGGGATHTIIEANIVAISSAGVVNISAGVLDISGVTIQNGKAGLGGGIFIDILGSLTLTNSTISGNSGIGGGGGIYNTGTLTIINSSISGNSGTSGGGIFSTNSTTIINSTISGNSVFSFGGGIFNNTGVLIIVNGTISGNSAGIDGGGIYNADIASTSIFNSTLTLNQADADLNGSGTGGGVFNSLGSSLNFKNSIIARNRESGFLISFFIPVQGDCAGTLTSQGFNIVSTPNCTINGPFSQAEPLLGPLQNNGGPTQTHALLSGSPAIDAGEVPSCTDNLGAPITTDQRGLHRPANGGVSLRCDIGAFELYRFGIFLPLIMH